jgi:hypothetical protein
MSEPRWADETQALVAKVLAPHWYDQRDAQAVLAALADAGLLIPPGGEVRECWQDYDTISGGSVGFDSLAKAVEWRKRHAKPLVPWDPPPHPTVTQVCTVTTWPDGSVHTGPWQPVPDA